MPRWLKILLYVVLGVVLLIAVAAGVIYGYYVWAPKPDLPAQASALQTVEHAGRQRHYAVVVPAGTPRGAPVLIVFHPSGSSGEDMRRMTGHALERIAQHEKFVVVYPDGVGGYFNDCRRVASYSARTLNIDDVGFVRRIVAELQARHGIDPTRVFALGYSNGAQMALRLALEAPDAVAGVAAIAANLPAPDNMDCRPATRPAARVVLIEGTIDPINPFNGGRVTIFGSGDRGNVLSAQASAEWFAQSLQASASTSTTLHSRNGLSARQTDWSSPQEGAAVRLIAVEGGGHTIPQADFRFPRGAGGTWLDDTLLESTWQFFTAPRP